MNEGCIFDMNNSKPSTAKPGEIPPAFSAGEAGLGTTGSRVCDKSAEARRRRFVLRRAMQSYADRRLVPRTEEELTAEGTVEVVVRMRPRDDRFIGCGRRLVSVADGARVHWDSEGKRAGVSGVQACGSVWVCAECAAKIKAKQAAELGEVLAWARREGHTIALATFSVQHYRRHSLDEVWDAVAAGWHAVTTGKEWVSERPERFAERVDRWDEARQLAIEGKGRYPRGGRANIRPRRRVGDQERFGLLGWARAVEVTNGRHGWHVHVHAVLVIRSDTPKAGVVAAEDLGARMYARWQAGVRSAGFDSFVNDEGKGGYDLRVNRAARCRLAEYLTKDGLADTPQELRDSVGAKGRSMAAEVARGDAKNGRRGGRSPFEILESIDWVAQPERSRRDLALWREWVRGSEGRRSLTWSTGLRELALKAVDDRTDEEIAAAAPVGEVVLELPRDTWVAVRDEVMDLLELVEREGPRAGHEWLEARGLIATYIPQEWFGD